MKKWQKIRSRAILENPWLTVREDAVRLPNGVEIPDFYTVDFPAAVAVAAFTPSGEVILKREYRYARGRELIEVPAGMVEPGEEDLAAAKRELLEETGYISKCWQDLGECVECSSKLTYSMHLFLAIDCEKVSAPAPDVTENIAVMKVPLANVMDMIIKDQIVCASTVHAIVKSLRDPRICGFMQFVL